MNKHASVDFNLCNPCKHDPEKGICLASAACKKGVLEQEDDFETPVLLSARMCAACGDCVRACPVNAISIVGGH